MKHAPFKGIGKCRKLQRGKQRLPLFLPYFMDVIANIYLCLHVCRNFLKVGVLSVSITSGRFPVPRTVPGKLKVFSKISVERLAE